MTPRISIDPKGRHGAACVAGARFPVHQVVHMVASRDMVESLLRASPQITGEELTACLELAAARSREA